MVGVPGRSKGCNTCIQRKVKCDGGQPTCGNCRKSQRLCTGYKRPVAFVMSSNVAFEPVNTEEAEGSTSIITQGRWRKRARKTPKAQFDAPKLPPAVAEEAENAAAAKTNTRTRANDAVDSTSASPVPDEEELDEDKRCWDVYMHPFREERRQNQLFPARKRQPVNTLEALSRAIAGLESDARSATVDFASPLGQADHNTMTLGLPTISHLPSEAAWREQLFPVFLSFYLPSELVQSFRDCRKSLRPLRPRNWLLNIPEVSLTGHPALETGMTALCMARVGRKYGNPGLVRHSLQLYTKGLRELQEAIHNPDTQLTDQTLAACMAFSMYEVAECPSKKLEGYQSHVAGGLVLMQMRGPDAHITPLGHSLFVFMRIQHFIYALLARKSNFFSQAEWGSKPWQTSTKDPHDKFMDQMYRIPVLLERTDLLAESTTDQDVLARGYWDIIGQYQSIYECLQGWYKDLQAVVAGPLYWPELSVIPCPEFDGNGNGRPFPVAFFFPAFPVGQSLVLYWVIVMVIHRQMSVLYKRIAGGGTAAGGAFQFCGVSNPIVDLKWSAMSETPSPVSASSLSPSAGASPATTTSTSAPPETAPRAEFPSSPAAALAAAVETNDVARTMAYNVCQSIEYYFRDNMGDIGPLSMLLPLTTVRHVLEGLEPLKPCKPGPKGRPSEYTDEVAWVDFLIRVIGGKGQQLAYHLDD